MSDSRLSSIATERHYSVSEVAKQLNLSDKTVRRMFEEEAGVLKISFPRLLQSGRRHKPHVQLRIPASVLDRVHQQRSAGWSLEVKPGRGAV